MDYKNLEYDAEKYGVILSTHYIDNTGTYFEQCPHHNGWFRTIKFGMLSKEIFLCSDCGEYYSGKELKVIRDK